MPRKGPGRGKEFPSNLDVAHPCVIRIPRFSAQYPSLRRALPPPPWDASHSPALDGKAIDRQAATLFDDQQIALANPGWRYTKLMEAFQGRVAAALLSRDGPPRNRERERQC